MNWLGIVILGIVILGIFKGFKRGIVRTAVSVCSLIVALILGQMLNPYISQFFIEQTPLYDTIREMCEDSISDTLEMKLNEQIGQAEQEELIQVLPLPEGLKTALLRSNNAEGYNRFLARTFGEYLSSSIAHMIVDTISLLIIYALVSVVMKLVGGVLDRIFELPVLSLINRMGGAVFGGIQGIFIVWFVFLIFALFWNTGWSQQAVSMIQENELTKSLYDNNLLIQFLSGIIGI